MTKILIVDDDPDIVESLSMVLEANGFQVAVKPDVDDIVEHVMAENPDLIILDIMFPEDSQAGFNAARALNRQERVKEIPIIILSAVNQASPMSFGFSDADISDDFMPVNAFLEKPVEPASLLAKIQQLLTPGASA